MLYDADCGLCVWLVSLLLAWDRRGLVRPCAIQGERAQGLLSDLGPEARLSSWHLISPDGGRSSGGAAFAPLLRLLPGGAPGAAVTSAAPGLSERGYRWVADHRSALSRLVPARSKLWAQDVVGRAEAEPGPGRPR